MKASSTRFLCLLLGVVLLTPWSLVTAEDTPGLFLQAYQDYQAAEKLEGESDPRRALLRYREAEQILSDIASETPDWQPLVVEYRLKRTRENIARLETQTAGMPPLDEELEGPLPSGPDRGVANPSSRTAILPPVTTVPATTTTRPSTRKKTEDLAQTPNVPPGTSSTLANTLRELNELKRQLQGLNSENQRLNSRIEKANADLKSALVELDRTKVNVVELKSQLAQANVTIENFKKDSGPGSGDLATVREEQERQMADFLKKLAEANADAEVLREENETLYSKLEHAANIISAGEQIRNTLLAERKSLAEASKTSEEEVTQIQEKLSQAETKLAEQTESQKAELAEQMEKARAAAEEVATLKTENQKLTDQLAAAKGAGASKAEIARLTKENADMAAKLADAEKRLSAEGRDVAISALQSELNSVNDRLLETQAQIASRDQRIEELVGQLDQTSAELARLKLLPEPSSDERKLLAENDVLRGIILRQIKMQNQRDEALRNLESELSRLKVESETLNVQLAILGSPVLELNPEERALFKDPVALLTDPDAGKLQVTMAITKPTEGEAAQNIAPKIAEGASSLTDETREKIRQAQEFFDQKNYPEAERIYLDIAQLHPDNYFVLSNLGAVQIEAGKPAAAEVALSKAIQISPEDSFAQTHLGIAFSRQGRFDDAQSALAKAIELNPTDAVAHNYLGVCLAQKGDRNSSEITLKKAIELDPSYANAHFNLAVLYATGKPPSLELAKQHYQLATKLGAAPDASLEQLIQ